MSADLLYNIGVLHVDRCEYEAATDLFGRAVGLAPTDAGLRLALAQCCFDVMRSEEAVAILAHPHNERYPSLFHLWAREGGLFINPSMVMDHDTMDERGRGLGFIELLMDDITINPSPEGTVIRFAKKLARNERGQSTFVTR